MQETAHQETLQELFPPFPHVFSRRIERHDQLFGYPFLCYLFFLDQTLAEV